MMKKKILVTGGAGSIGSNIVKKLVDNGAEVTIVDNLSAYPFDYRNEFGTAKLENTNFLPWDIVTDKEQINKLVQQVDVVIHAASFADVAAGIKNAQMNFEVNITATQNILESCRKANIEKFIFISSASVYGNSENTCFQEDIPCFPVSTYGLSKYWGEQQTRLYHELYGLPTTSLRFFSVYGSPQIPKKGSHSWVIAIFSMLIKKRNPITIYWNGNHIRDFIHVTDVAESVVLSIDKNSTTGKFLNIGTGIPTKIKDIPGKIFKHLDEVPITIENTPLPIGDPKGGYADTTIMKKLLNWTPKWDLEKGIKEYIEWLNKNEHLIPKWLYQNK